MMESRFTALRTIGGLLKLSGWLVMLAALGTGFLGAVTALVGRIGIPLLEGLTPPDPSLLGSLALVGGGLVAGLLLIGAGEVIDLLIAIEENTRAAALLLAREEEPPAGEETP